MKKWRIILCFSGVMLLSLMLSFNAQAGKIVLANDEWTLSNSGFFSPNDPDVFATNIASWFTGGNTGNFLVYSANFGLTGSSLANTMTSASHGWNVTMGVSFDLATLSAYDGIFLAGNAADTSVLTDYVNAGGNVYLAGGTGWGGAAAEAARWNPFLNNFGLEFAPFYNYGLGFGNAPISSTHDIFDGVDYLYQLDGNDTLDIMASDPRSQVLVSYEGHGLYAVYDSDAGVIPEPATLLLLGSGLAGIAALRHRKQK